MLKKSRKEKRVEIRRGELGDERCKGFDVGGERGFNEVVKVGWRSCWCGRLKSEGLMG
jgi:hypothetical protein